LIASATIVSESPAPNPEHDAQAADRLRRGVRGFVRKFGLLATDATPCGRPLSVSHAYALAYLLEQRGNGPITQQLLGAALGIDKSNVARLCARMESLGHIEQQVAPDDGRSRHLELTTAGLRLARSVERASLERFTGLLGAVPDGERAAVVAAIESLNAALERLANAGKAGRR
jgi:DNA-binding MarR family transcriptional regulator